MIVDSLLLRGALPSDATYIAALLAPYAVKGIVLPRTVNDILSCIDNFLVAVDGDRVVGAVALRDFGEGLEEIRSLVVEDAYASRGLGSKLILTAVELAARRSTTRLFTLTLRPRLFERLGFRLVEKDMFPQKVWADCAKCKKRDHCDEFALLVEM